MEKTRILLVDDSSIVRRIVGAWLSSEPDFEVVGTAPNGRLALDRIEALDPDAVVMDIEMPIMDGLTTLRELRKRNARLPVIMFSTLTERGGIATLEALSLGASDYLTKPSPTELQGGTQQTRDQLALKLRALVRPRKCPLQKPSTLSTATAIQPRPVLPSASRTEHIELVAIGCSTGGPNALEQVLPCLPANLPVPIVIVQHMPPMFTELLARRLNDKCELEVCEAKPNMRLESGKAYLAPGDWHMVVKRAGKRAWIETHQDPPENSCRPAVDVLFRSVAETYGGSVLGLVLTGMGQDGLRGAELLVQKGARMVVQDEASSVVWGMPGFVARAGLAERVLPLPEIGQEILRRVQKSEAAAIRKQA
ncbi:MAG: chemotaxis response regulator protein-glutamate methylesterase [Planctomycetes bacterium]|nr:chemotaxis response regulator protein-glutamate methylesterase [Planctomycetota bacterium]